MMLAFLPLGWDDALGRDRPVETEPGSETGLLGGKQTTVEKRPISLPRPRPAVPAVVPRVGVGVSVAIAPRRAAPSRRETPYLPHPSRFSERRLI
jgi:hypothetical protein